MIEKGVGKQEFSTWIFLITHGRASRDALVKTAVLLQHSFIPKSPYRVIAAMLSIARIDTELHTKRPKSLANAMPLMRDKL